MSRPTVIETAVKIEGIEGLLRADVQKRTMGGGDSNAVSYSIDAFDFSKQATGALASGG